MSTHENIALLGHAAAVATTLLTLVIAIWVTRYVARLAAQDFGPALYYQKAS